MIEPLRLWSDRLTTPIGELIVLTDREKRMRIIHWVDHEDRMQYLLRLLYGPCGFTIEPRQAHRPPDAAPNQRETQRTWPPPARPLCACSSEDSAAHIAALRAYFAGDLTAIDNLPVETAGTLFQRLVWRALREIPCGQTISYAQLAQRIGRPAAARAVGLANGANPVSIVVPCHRVIGASGSLTGYGGGLERKRWLLTHEDALTSPGARTSVRADLQLRLL